MVLTLKHLLLFLLGLVVLCSSSSLSAMPFRGQSFRSYKPHPESRPRNYKDKKPIIFLKPAIGKGSIFPTPGNPPKTSKVDKPFPEQKTPIYKSFLFCIWITTCILFWFCQASGSFWVLVSTIHFMRIE